MNLIVGLLSFPLAGASGEGQKAMADFRFARHAWELASSEPDHYWPGGLFGP